MIVLENGFIKLHRKMVNWEWYTDTNTKVVFFHLILTANYEPKKFKGRTIERGQRVASFSTLAGEINLTIQQIRTAINHLKTTGEITSEKTNGYTVFTVVNYAMYQGKQQAEQQTNNKQTTNEQQTNNKRLTTMKEIKKDKKDKKYICAPAPKIERPKIPDAPPPEVYIGGAKD